MLDEAVAVLRTLRAAPALGDAEALLAGLPARGRGLAASLPQRREAAPRPFGTPQTADRVEPLGRLVAEARVAARCCFRW